MSDYWNKTYPIDLWKDNVTGVLFNHNDATQAAGHPNATPVVVRPTRGDTIKRDEYAIKAATPIAGVVVRKSNL